MNLRSLVPSFNRGHGSVMRPEVNMFGSLQREVDRLFDDFSASLSPLGALAQDNLMPSMNVAETDNAIEITVEMPGLERSDVDLSLVDDVLVIRGEKKDEHEQEDKDRNYRLVERRYGMFYRTIELPPGVDPRSIKATMSNGVLKLTMPKPTRSEAQKIEVKEESKQNGQQQAKTGGQQAGKQGAGAQGRQSAA
jgi:HSP20 family protein